MGSHALGTPPRPLRVAIVGAGPAGFYAVEALLKRRDIALEVDVFDRMPTPFGLVRFGVAPDHQKIKNVVRAYEKLASDARVRFLGNVQVGSSDLTIDDLTRHYDQIVVAIGSSADRRLGIPGEDLGGSHAATHFVAWYNGHPEFQDYAARLGAEDAIVVGAGDVALDVARLLLKTHAELASTDMADHALSAFRDSQVRRVTLLCRRGPAQVAFAIKELEDIAELPGVDVRIDPDPVREALASAEGLDGLTRRKVSYLFQLANRPARGAPRTFDIRFFSAPVRALGTDGKLSALEVQRTRLVTRPDGRVVAEGTEEHTVLPAGLLFRAIGYRGVALPGLPFDERAGVIPSEAGRVLIDGKPSTTLYVAGWIKRGPTGVIGTNKSDAAETVASMLSDIHGQMAADEETKTRAAVDRLLAGRGARVVSYDDWCKLDRAEQAEGARLGRVRRKFVSVAEMLAFLDRQALAS